MITYIHEYKLADWTTLIFGKNKLVIKETYLLNNLSNQPFHNKKYNHQKPR